MKEFFKKMRTKQKENAEKGSRQAVLEDLFYDFNQSRVQIYKMNFVRGIFLGFGTVIGGTLVVALVVAILSLLVDLPGGVGDFIRYIVDIVKEN